MTGTGADEIGGTLLVISLAPALDRYARAPSFTRAAINRPSTVNALAGGKGLNAARTAVRLGVRTRTVALVGGFTGVALRELAAAEGLAVTWVDSEVQTRQCLSLLDESDGSMTEVYEAVLPVPAEVWPRVLAAVRSELTELSGSDAVAISGRVPPGLPDDALAQLVDLCAEAGESGVPVLVDSDGEQLNLAVRRGPTLVKVNAGEASAATGVDPDRPWDAAKALQVLGAQTVVITLGPGGALCLAPDGHRFEVAHDPLERALPVGSGDAFLAGLAARRLVARRLAARGPVARLVASGLSDVPTELPADVPSDLPSDLGADLPAGLPSDLPSDLPSGLLEDLRYAAAAGRANARHLEAGSCTPAGLAAELPHITARSL
jgi:fructose-1-phosphate kinase PfkB-like protein